MDNETYIGDGVYASHDGFQIWLAVNDHHNKVVALEPTVIANLIAYAKEIGIYPRRKPRKRSKTPKITTPLTLDD